MTDESVPRTNEAAWGGDLDYRAELQKDVVRGSLWTVVGSAIALPLTFIVNLLVVRSLGSVQYGQFAFLTAAFSIALTVIDAGVNGATIQWLAEARAIRDVEQQRMLLRRCAGYHIFVEAPLLGIITGVLLRAEDIQYIIVAVVANIIVRIGSTGSVYLTATVLNALAARIALATTLATQTCVAYAAESSHSVGASWAAQAAAAVVYPILMSVCLPRAVRRQIIRPKAPCGWPPGFIRFAITSGLGTIAALLVYGRSEIFVLRVDGQLTNIAMFAIAAGLATQLTVLIDSIMGPLIPASTGVVTSMPALAAEALYRTLRLSSILGAITASVGIPLLAVIIRPLYGTQFGSAELAFVGLALVSCLQSAAHPFFAFAFATRSAASVLIINGICLLMDAALAFSLIPVYGLAGAVVANMAAQVTGIVLCCRVITRKLHRPTMEAAKALRAFLLGPAIALVSLILSQPFDNRWVRASAVLLVSVAGLLAGFRLFPGIRMTSADSRAIEVALPSHLARAWRSGVRQLSLVEKL